jgi:H+-translocating NAD(P) transhydrogenase subunit alpha
VRVLIPKECSEGETRVAATPETVKSLIKAGLEVVVERAAGEAASFDDKVYEAAGAKIAEDPAEAFGSADLVLKVAPFEKRAGGLDEATAIKKGAVVIGLLAPYASHDMVRTLAEREVSSIAMELVPRITRAQKMDALSSQANIAGYKAVIMAAANLPKYFPLLMTAAGTIKPARVVIMGAGVAGLQAIATAKRLGAVVEASDIRAAVKEQVESLGGKFIPLPDVKESGEGAGGYAKEMSAEFLAEQRKIVRTHLLQADVVITTALIPGKPAPKLVPADVVAEMKRGAVIVDLAVGQGGNCELSEKGKEVRKHGVLILGHPNLPATVPGDASLVYARNVWALVDHLLGKERKLTVDPADEITGACLLTHEGKVAHKPTAQALGMAAE